MALPLRLIAGTQDVRHLLAGTLADNGILCHTEGEMIVCDLVARSVTGDEMVARCATGNGEPAAPETVVGLLRDALSGPELEEVSVVEEMDFPHEFPVTTRLEAWWSVFETSWFEKAVAAGSFSIWFQPVVDTTARRTIGHECLLRLTKGHRREGAEIMAAAGARRDLRAFDAYARELAIRSIAAQGISPGSMAPRSVTGEVPRSVTGEVQRSVTGEVPRSVTGSNAGMYFVNFVPSGIGKPSSCLARTVDMLNETGLPSRNFVLESVQSNRNPDAAQLRRIGDYLREQGLGFALDDVSADAEALRLVCDVRPDYIKIERRLVRRLERPHQANAVRKLVEVAERLGVRVIAKGVDRVSAMEWLRAVGVQCMQGYLFGGPSPEIARTAMDLAHLARAIAPSAQPDGAGGDESAFASNAGEALQECAVNRPALLN